MSKFSKILIPVFLALSISAGFTVFSFSNTQNGGNDISSTETSNQNFISSDTFTEGTVYICPEAASMEEVNPRCPGKKILKLGETIDGLTLTTTNYEGQDYYMVLGFENGGGAVNLPPIADAGAPYEEYSGLPITFDASSSTDPNNDSLQYRWDFENDGVWDTDWLDVSTTTHIWNNDYEGIVNLEVNDGEFVDAATAPVKITPFLWNYTFTDNSGRNTTLELNTENKLFHFVGPNLDTGVINAPQMKIIKTDNSFFKYQSRSKTWTINPNNKNIPLEIKSLVMTHSFKEMPKEIILITYRNENMTFAALAIDSKIDFCVGLLYRKPIKKVYLLIDKPGLE